MIKEEEEEVTGVLVRAVAVVVVVESCARVVLSGLVYFPGGHGSPAYTTQNTLITVRMLNIVLYNCSKISETPEHIG